MTILKHQIAALANGTDLSDEVKATQKAERLARDQAILDGMDIMAFAAEVLNYSVMTCPFCGTDREFRMSVYSTTISGGYDQHIRSVHGEVGEKLVKYVKSAVKQLENERNRLIKAEEKEERLRPSRVYSVTGADLQEYEEAIRELIDMMEPYYSQGVGMVKKYTAIADSIEAKLRGGSSGVAK